MYTRISWHLLKYLLLIALILFTIPGSLYSSNTSSVKSDTTIIIQRIIIDGNRRTKDKTVLLFLNIDTGTVYDSSLIDTAVNNLKTSGLFSHVKIFPIINGNIATLLVILRETSYLTISDIGGEIYNMKYGGKDGWWRARLGFTYTNFRGRNEWLGIHFSCIESRSISISWQKPFISNPYFIGLATGIKSSPSLIEPKRVFSLWHQSTVGRKIAKKSKMHISLIPTYNSQVYKGVKGTSTYSYFYMPDSLVDSTSPWFEPSSNPPKEFNITWNDTIITDSSTIFDPVQNDSIKIYEIKTTHWKGADRDSIKENYESDYYEAFLRIGWRTDLRDSYFDTRKGTYFSANILSNFIYPRIKDSVYVQLSTESRLYHRGIFPSNTIAYRLRTIQRVGNPDNYKRLYAGGEATLRGYYDYYFARNYIANNRILFSWEYRFPILQTPEMDFPRLSRFHHGLKNFYYRIDGALIIDCAYLWEELQHPLKNKDDKTNGGVGIGVGFRFMCPTIKRSVSLDFVWGEVTREEWKYWVEEKGKSKIYPYLPKSYLYIDMHY